MKRRIVNLSSVQLSTSETNLLQKGLNFCPTPPPPSMEELDRDINAFARRLFLKEYHFPEDIEDLEDIPPYQPTIQEKLNKKDRTY